jgi:hypothetical protein
MLTVLVSVASAAMPQTVDLEDLDRWEAGMTDLLDGPAGCWAFEGQVEMATILRLAPSQFSRSREIAGEFAGTFSGQLEGGRWTRFDVVLKRVSGDKAAAEAFAPFPMTGRIDLSIVTHSLLVKGKKKPLPFVVSSDGGDVNRDATSSLHRLIEEIDPEAATAYADWDDDAGGVLLVQDVPLTDANNAPTVKFTTLFPGGGLATQLDIVFPQVSPARGLIGLPAVEYRENHAHLRTRTMEGVAWPAEEISTFQIGTAAGTASYKQDLIYTRATECAAGAPVAAAAPAPAPAPEPAPVAEAEAAPAP